jgi:hypothetical protein
MQTTPRHALPSRIRDAAEHFAVSWLVRQRLAVGASVLAFGLLAITVVAPPAPASAKELLAAYNARYGQTVTVASTVQLASAVRDDYNVMPGIPQLAKHGTNFDWAKIVLLDGEFPVTSNNVTVLTRWMRQENGPNNWWNRNNPLNNGWGSGGGGGTGSYPNLLVAASYAAKALRTHPGYAGIVAALDADSPTEVTERAIWASPWASGHYANGGHWHYTPVAEFTAPTSAWG